MADNLQENVAEGLGEEPKKSKLIPILILVNVLVLATIAGFIAFGSESGEEQAAQANHPGPVGMIVPLKGFTVNLNDRKGTKYLKVGLNIELADENLQDVVVERDAIMRHNIIIYLSGLKSSEVQGAENKLMIVENLTKRLNEAIGVEDGIKQVYLTEFRWQ